MSVVSVQECLFVRISPLPQPLLHEPIKSEMEPVFGGEGV